MKIVMLGAFATGKGTQAVKLSRHLRIPHISTGDMFREEMKKGSSLGMKVKGYYDKGYLVPDDLTIRMLSERLPKTGFILDGFPRTIKQADELGKITTIDLVINIDLPESEIIERVTGRLTCSKCGAIYHEKFIPPKKTGVCDRCGGSLGKRSDESEDAVKQRFRAYEENTKPLIEYYKKKGLLKNVSGLGSPEEVFERMKSLIKE